MRIEKCEAVAAFAFAFASTSCVEPVANVLPAGTVAQS